MAVAAPVAIRTGDTAASTGEGEGRANDDTAFADKTAADPRAASNGEAAKPVAQAFILPGAETSADVRPLSSSARPIASDQFANVERVVDQIMAARQADLSKPAAIAVAHREFGQLTVTFDRTADGMNVEIAAQDGEMQRALAAAMANERPVARQHDGASIAANTTNANAPAGGERGPAPMPRATVRAMRIPMSVTRPVPIIAAVRAGPPHNLNPMPHRRLPTMRSTPDQFRDFSRISSCRMKTLLRNR